MKYGHKTGVLETAVAPLDKGTRGIYLPHPHKDNIGAESPL